jgi:phosphinothricin acetyltransferase
MSFLIRPSTENDIADITRIYSGYVLHGTATFELEPPDMDEIGRRRSSVLSLGLPFLVAEQDGEVAGYAYAGVYRPRPAYRFTVEDSIYVDPRYTGKGGGRMLLNELIRSCEQGPWRQMIAVIGDSENAASIRLHVSCGFCHVGNLRDVGFKFDRWLDSVLMQRELGSFV